MTVTEETRNEDGNSSEETVYVVSGTITPITESKNKVIKYKLIYRVYKSGILYNVNAKIYVKSKVYKLVVTANKIVEKEPEIEPTTKPTEAPTEPTKKPKKPNKKPKKDCTNPKTGDDSHVNEYLVSMGLSLAGLSVLDYHGIKEKI